MDCSLETAGHCLLPSRLITSNLLHARANVSQGLWRRVVLFVLSVALSAQWLVSTPVIAQANEWTWMGGSALSVTGSGAYGTLGMPSQGNIPGSRGESVTWTDKSGNLWLFGGEGTDANGNFGYLNDLWEFNPASQTWTWVSGTSTLPDCSHRIPCGAPGSYGTLGTPGSGNAPGARAFQTGWVDNNGNLWMFGGAGFDSTGTFGGLNDVWKFDPTTRLWTWMAGANTVTKTAVYGTLGTASVANTPGPRSMSASWTDGNGNLWLFGGDGYDANANGGYLSDLWEFSPSTNEWAWMGGLNSIPVCSNTVCGNPGTYGNIGMPATGNLPGGRVGATAWADSSGNVWLFGGEGFDAKGSFSPLNDLWKLNFATGEWTWISGSNVLTTTAIGLTSGVAGIYGELQIPATGNVPGGRWSASGWTDPKGNLWLFGGAGFDSAASYSVLNDLWKFTPSTGEWTWMSGADTISQNCYSFQLALAYCGEPGVYGTLQVPALGNDPGGRTTALAWTGGNGKFWLFGGSGFDSSGNYEGYLADLWQFQTNTDGQPVTATPVFSPGSGTYSSWQTVSIEDSTPGATINYLINGNPPAAVYTGPITVASTKTIEAIASATGYSNSDIATASYIADLPVAATPIFSVAPGNYGNAQSVTITDATPGATIYYAIGAAPSIPTSIYTGPILVSSSETLWAMAVAENYENSALATGAYNIGPNSSGQWIWMGGSSLVPEGCPTTHGCGAAGWSGIRGAPAPANIPGARTDASTWTDKNGNLWLFGGIGYDSAGATGALNDLWEFSPATGEWTWVSGSSATTYLGPQFGDGTFGVYGTLGTPGAMNTPGGRWSASSWTDSNGDLWLFGGKGFDGAGSSGFLNDLWKFDPSTVEWTWMGGSDAVPCFGCGVLGQYGIEGIPAAVNMPGGRFAATTWTDRNGNFWMYGGTGYDSRIAQGVLNDLWKFDPSTNDWTWMGGSRFAPSNWVVAGWPGNYGNLGIPALGNTPWSLQYPSSWTDTSGHLWLFGGSGVDPNGDALYMNDMWEFYPSLNAWAWTSANSGDAFGVYGTMGEFAPANTPGARYKSASWTDGTGNLWLFGGMGAQNAQLQAGVLNDLWEFNPAVNEWKWMSGSSVPSQTGGFIGQYGTLGVPSAANTPGGRQDTAEWTDASGNLWLFGGQGVDAQDNQGTLNDMWVYTLAGTAITQPPTQTASPTFSLSAGTYTSEQSLTIFDQTAGAIIFYTTDGKAPNANSAIYSTPISISTSETVNAIALASGDAVSPIASVAYTINLPPAATPTFSIPSGTYSDVQNVTISDTTAGARIYYTTDGAAPTANSALYGGAITVSTTETINAIAVASGYANSAIASATYTIEPAPNFTLAASPGALTVKAGGQGVATLTVTPQNGFNSTVSFSCAGLPSGISCLFNPSTVTPSGGAATSTLTIAATTQAAVHMNGHPLFPLASLGVTLCLLGLRRRRSLLFLILLTLGSAVLLTSCGGTGAGGSGSASQPVNATITVTAKSGTIQRTASIYLTVN
jgi:N-acetylneuraminic acid mutarotase